jgi:hypothetical protein
MTGERSFLGRFLDFPANSEYIGTDAEVSFSLSISHLLPSPCMRGHLFFLFVSLSLR